MAGGVVATTAPVAQGTPPAPPAAKTMAAEQSADRNESPALILASLNVSEPDRYLIRNATMTIETADVRKAADQVTGLVQSVKGYTADAHESVDGLGVRSVTVEARIPFPQFDHVLQQIEALGKVLDRQVNAQDVTEEFVDTQSKLRNLKKTEERLLDHLSKTGKLSDTLLVEKELTRVREEIEQLEGRVRFLANRIAFSTLTLTFKETPRPEAVVPPETFSSGKVASDAMRTLVGFVQAVWSVVIWLAVWAIVWLPPLLAVGYFVRREQRAARSRRA